MPKRTDINSILIIGAGPIVIGQACEFDYSGAQACKALREEGFRVILVNSNPATIMTDPEMADATYIEPINWRTVRAHHRARAPDALLPTMGGQTALNCALDLAREGVLERYGVEMIGASRRPSTRPRTATCFARRCAASASICRVRPRPQPGRGAPGQAGADRLSRHHPAVLHHGRQRRRHRLQPRGVRGDLPRGLDLSPTSELLIEESVLGWKEYEMEVVRDRGQLHHRLLHRELRPMGVHTGDSITVAPAQTLTDKEYQIMRDASLAVLREIGVDTGGSNVQFAINPETGA
jgi:carbamoyl-phosphate synthase large subunit